jgi:hypothetical protein
MTVQGSTQDQSQPVDWVDLVAGIRAGDEKAVVRLAAIFQDGIRFFLRRGLGPHKLQRRQREVLSLVVQSIQGTSIDSPNRVASLVLAVLQQYISSQRAAGPYVIRENEVKVENLRAIRKLLAKIAAVDEEAVRRYYVDRETSEQICRSLNITSARFQAVRSNLRAGVR